MASILEIDSINISIGSKKILSDVYLKCETNDIIGVFGLNGSGKSTLLKIIFGTLTAESSFIKLNNCVLKKAYLLTNGISFLPQNHFIPSNLTVEKTIKLFVKIEHRISFFNDSLLQPILKSKISSLSEGEVNYFEVKLIVFNDSKFCILDEPFSGLSPIMAEKIAALIVEKAKVKGIIITDPNYKNVLAIATKIFLIKDTVGKMLKNKQELQKIGYKIEIE